jgi:hypothetical protein
MNRVSDFMIQLTKDLVEKKQVAESSASLYIRNLWTLNNKQPFNNLSFLRDTGAVEEKLNAFADSTRKTYLASIVSVLSLYKDKPTYKKIYTHYHEKMMSKASEMRNNESTEKTEKQKDNWISWEEVNKVKTELATAVKEFAGQKLITPQQYNTLLAFVVLSLYTDVPPRRNQDYSDMFVVGQWKDTMDKTKNYYDVAGKRFIFNKYKTAKKYGTQIVDIKDTPVLQDILTIFLKHHPLHKGKITKTTEFRFLAYSDGSPLSAVNSITRILNKVFGKKVGSSMLRHIYLSDKYDIKEMEKDAEAMGHSVEEQKKYMKE